MTKPKAKIKVNTTAKKILIPLEELLILELEPLHLKFLREELSELNRAVLAGGLFIDFIGLVGPIDKETIMSVIRFLEASLPEST